MTRTSLTTLAATMVLAATGCASNRIVGHNLKQVGRWYGELGITGHLNEITVQSRSRLTKLSIIGDANHVVVEDHATLGKIEIWGENNTVSVPGYLVVRSNQVGKGTRIIRRPRETSTPARAAAKRHAPPGPAEAEHPVEPAVEPPNEESNAPGTPHDALE
ncbi:MAG: hypothetical protein ACE5I3_06255 [Phycisphaerae bacterium]